MLTRVRITNFRGFRELDAPIAPVTAFLGPNSSGKTTALHAIRLACDTLRFAIDSEMPAQKRAFGSVPWIVVTSGTLIGDHARLMPLADWRALFVDQNVGEGVSLVVGLVFAETDPLQEIRVEVTCARNEQLKLDVRVRSNSALTNIEGLPKKSPSINQRLTEFLREHSPVAVFVPPFYGTVREEEYRARVVLDRLLGSGDQSHVVRNLVAALSSDQFTQLNAFLDATVGATLTDRTTGDRAQTEYPMSVRFRDSNGEIELSAAGAGLVNLIALFASLSRWQSESSKRGILFLLDEPEAHLHPRLQAESAERLSRLVTGDFAAQLILATHSVDILNRLATVGASLLRCDRQQTPSVVSLDNDAKLFDDLAEWVDLQPYTAINFLASRRVLFCEGDGDAKLLPRLAEVRFRNDPARLQRFRRWAIVQLKGASNQPIAKLLARLVQSDMVRARAQKEGFEVVVVLDRDHSRTPGKVSSTESGVVETQVVWHRHSLESLFLDGPILSTWLRAYVGAAVPPDLSERILAALAAADADHALNEQAKEQLTAQILKGDVVEDGVLLRGDQRIIHAMRQAAAKVAADPSAWQQGKSRASFVLGQLRPAITLPEQNQFTTDLVRLFLRTDLNRIGELQAAVPAEVGALLDDLVATAKA